MNDYYDFTPDETMDESMWEDMPQQRNEYLDRAWEEKEGDHWVNDCDEGDYYSLSPLGHPIPW
jgi:hypothetical protein